MKLSSKLSMSSPIRRAIDAVEMSLRAMELMDETVWIMQMIAYKYEDMLPEDSILKLKDIQNHLKDEIHETNVATNEIFVHLEDEVASHGSKVKYKSILMPKEIVAYENDKKILIRFPADCNDAGYSTWLSKKFVTEDPAGDNLQVRYYPDWKISLYRYERAPSGRMEPVDKREINAQTFTENIQAAANMYQLHDPGISYQEG